MKSQRSKATDISQKVKRIVWERDGHKCIFCGSYNAMPNTHVISRAYGGLGIPENVVTSCLYCHRKMDQSKDRETYVKIANQYLDSIYGKRNKEDLIYKKFYERT